jgi:hypothetical protein
MAPSPSTPTRRPRPRTRRRYEEFWAGVPEEVKTGLDRMIAVDAIFDQLDAEEQEAVVEDFRQMRTPADYKAQRFRETVHRARCFTGRRRQAYARPRASRGRAVRSRASRRTTATRAGPDDDSGGDKPPGEPPPLAGRRSTTAGVAA